MLPVFRRSVNCRRAIRSFLISLCLVVVQWSAAEGDTVGGQSGELEELIKNVLSQDCEIRSRATMGFIKNAEATSLLRLREELEKKSPGAATYLKDAFTFVEAQELAEANTLSTIKNGIKVATEKVPDTEENQPRIAKRLAEFLLSKIRVESPVNQMMLVGYLADRAKHYTGEPEEKVFRKALESLLFGADQRLRVFAAASLSMKKLKERQVLTPILLTGLESGDFSARYFSLTALQAAGIPETCFNPLDTPEQRRQPLAALKQWWEEESRKGKKMDAS